jgi:hypothetical protein
MPNGPFPSKNADFHDYVDTVVPYLNANAARLGVSATNAALLNTLYDNAGVPQNNLGWVQLWGLHINDDIGTKTVTALVALRRSELEGQLRTIYDDIPKSALTANDRTTLNKSKRDSEPTNINPVGYSPVLSVAKIEVHTHTLRISDPENPTTRAMPYGNRVEITHFVGEKGLSGDAIAFADSKTIGRFLVRFIYTEADQGKTAYYRARYYTKRGVGAWGSILSVIVA